MSAYPKGDGEMVVASSSNQKPSSKAKALPQAKNKVKKFHGIRVSIPLVTPNEDYQNKVKAFTNEEAEHEKAELESELARLGGMKTIVDIKLKDKPTKPIKTNDMEETFVIKAHFPACKLEVDLIVEKNDETLAGLCSLALKELNKALVDEGYKKLPKAVSREIVIDKIASNNRTQVHTLFKSGDSIKVIFPEHVNDFLPSFGTDEDDTTPSSDDD